MFNFYLHILFFFSEIAQATSQALEKLIPKYLDNQCYRVRYIFYFSNDKLKKGYLFDL